MVSRCCKGQVEVLIDYYICLVCHRPTDALVLPKGINKDITDAEIQPGIIF
jgi:hypothetical protein